MIREEKNRFWLTTFLTLTLLISAISICVANIFYKEKLNVNAMDFENKVAVSEASDDVTWQDSSKSTVSVLGPFGPTTEFKINAISGETNKTYQSGFTVTIEGEEYTPIPQPGYKVTAIKIAGTPYTSGTVIMKDADPSYSGKVKVEAVTELINYDLYMYYSKDGTNWDEQKVQFNVENETELTSIASTSDRVFSHWAILSDGISISGEVAKYNNIEFELSDTNLHTSGDGKSFYYIKSVKGYSDTISNFKIDDYSNYASVKDSAKIRATWSYNYNGELTVEKTATTRTNVGLTNGPDVIGTRVGSETASTTATLKFSSSGTNYKFKSNSETAFETVSADADYFIYNYGYEISHWNIYFGSGENTKYAQYSDSAWSITGSIKSNAVTTLGSDGLTQKLANTLDAYFLSGYDNTEIYLEPVWQAVKIKVYTTKDSTDYILVNSCTYNTTYSTSVDTALNSIGQTLYWFKTTSGNVIANGDNLKWNYEKIPQSDFEVDSGIYKLKVDPEYADNIYRITLKEFQSKKNGDYVISAESIEEVQYTFATIGNSESSYTIYSNNIGLTTTMSGYSSGDSIETYIENCLKTRKTEYDAYIKYDNYITNYSTGTTILRKVYTNSGSISTDKKTLTGTTNPTLWIYLANNQKAGRLPVFVRDYYDLISWDTPNTYPYKYSYITSKYDNTAHASELTGRIQADLLDNEWLLTQMGANNSSNLELVAHNFRKSYLIDLNTIKGGAEGRYGYIYLKVTDITEPDNAETHILAVYKDSEMKYYDVSGLTSINVNSINGKTALDSSSSKLKVKTEGLKDILCVLIYSGCDLEIKASSVDYLSRDYETMVGYYLSAINTSNDGKDLSTNNPKPDLFEDVNYDNISNKAKGCHTINVTAEQLENKEYETNTKIVINAVFAPIDYELNIYLKDGSGLNPYSGSVKCKDKSTTDANASLNFTTINIENWQQIIEYFANAGYTLQTNAYTVGNHDNSYTSILQSYNSAINTSETNSQQYAFILTSGWLLDNYYTKTDGSIKTDGYDAQTNNIQSFELSVNVELLQLDYVVEIVNKETNELIETRTYTKVAQMNGSSTSSNIAIITLNSTNYTVISQKLVGNEFVKYGSEDFYIISSNGKYYVPLSSKMSQFMDARNYTLNYDFLLLTLTETGDNFTQERANSIFGGSTIINTDKRKLLMQIDVAELYSVTLNVKKHANPDINDSVRSTTITNGTNNIKTLTSYAGSDYTETIVAYTYEGALNNLTSSYNTNRYTDVLYNLGNVSSNLASASFNLKQTNMPKNAEGEYSTNINLYVTYIPKPIGTFNVTYYLNGLENRTAVIDNGILQEVQLPNSSIELYAGQSVVYEYKILNPMYIVSVSLNGTKVNDNPLTCVVDSSVYDAGGIYILVDVMELPTGSVSVRYVLADSNKGCTTDDFGTISVYANGVEATSTTRDEWTIATVAEGCSVELDISGLAQGYHFVKVGENTTVVDNKISIISSFNTSRTNVYSITIDKDVIKSVLTVEGDYKEKYIMTVHGLTSSKTVDSTKAETTIDAYLGKTITFNEVNENKELLDYYYYIDKNNVEHEIEKVAGTIQLELTASILSDLTKTGNEWSLNIGAKRIAKYKLTYSIVNSIYVEDFEINQYVYPDLAVDAGEYVSGTNLINGSKVELSLTAKDNKIAADGTIEDAKYNITLTGCLEETIGAGECVRTIVLDSDKTLVITLTPKDFTHHYSEYIYNTLQDYKDFTPTESTTAIGGFTISDLVYGKTAEVRINLISEEGELAFVELIGNDNDTFIINLDGNEIVSVYNVTDNIEYVVDAKYAKRSTATTQIADVTQVLQSEGYVVKIANEGSAKLILSYVVKNVITINAEYVSYKTIKPLN